MSCYTFTKGGENLGVSKVIVNGVTRLDLTSDTVAPGNLLSPETATGADGERVTGSIATKTSSDLTASGATVTAPAGHYASAASKSVVTATQATPSVSINNSTGLVTATATQTAGYVSAGSKSGTLQLTTQAATTITPTESEQTAVAANVYTTGIVKVGAISSTYVGSGITQNDSSDLTVSGATVTVPAGHYETQATKSVASGSATIDVNMTVAPIISVNASTGLITSSNNTSVGAAPTVTAGYVSSGTTGSVYVHGSSTKQLPTQAAQTLYPSTADQTIASGVYLTGTQTIAAIKTTNLSADVIKSGVTVKIGDDVDDDRVAAVTGTFDGEKSVSVSDVNFIDYDGTVLYAYSAAEANALSALPANPSHPGLIAQGWNWTLAQIKAQLSAQPGDVVWVGQMYVTESGNTEIDVELHDGRLSPYLGIAVNGTVVIDWGDNTSTNTVTGSSLTTQIRTNHTYSSAGSYTITISVSSGSFAFFGTGTYFLLSKNSSTGNLNRVYAGAVKAVRIGNNASIGNYAFYLCDQMSTITIPSSVSSIGSQAFAYCYALSLVILPSAMTSIGTYAFYYIYGQVVLPAGITSIGTYAFQNAVPLSSVTIPSDLTSIGTNAFYGCYNLVSVTIPPGVTTIPSNAFYNCYGLGYIKFRSSTPPAVSASNAFTNLPTDCILYVPSGSLSAYTSAVNYPSSSTYTYTEY